MVPGPPLKAGELGVECVVEAGETGVAGIGDDTEGTGFVAPAVCEGFVDDGVVGVGKLPDGNGVAPGLSPGGHTYTPYPL